MSKTKLLFIVLLCGFLIAPQVSLAIGQMTKPIVIDNALRGQEIEETLILYNSEEKEVTYGLNAEGDIKDWTTFYSIKNLEKPITEIKIPAESNINALVKFNIPNDTPNGVYTGQVAVVTLADETEKQNEGMNVSVGMRVGRDVSITVTDKEMISFQTSIIPLDYGVKKGEPLKIKIIYDNQGNVSIRPQIDLKILKDDKTVFNAIFPYPEDIEAVKPLERKELPAFIEWQTIGQEDGRYQAEVKIMHNDKVAYENSFTFLIGQAGQVLGASSMKIIWPLVGVALIIVLALVLFIVKKRLATAKNN